MSDTVKLIIEIPKEAYKMCQDLKKYDDGIVGPIAKGVPLDSVKAEIDKFMPWIYKSEVLGILDNIGKESEVKPNE